MAINVKKQLKKVTKRNYLAKDFDAFRTELLAHARLYFPDKIQDFSEASLGGLFLDMAAYVGDSMAFYLDHQFNELNWSTAVEQRNVQKHIRQAGVKMKGAAPAHVDIDIYFEIPAETISGEQQPKANLLPKILSKTRFASNNGVIFSLLEDCDFAEKDNSGNYLYQYVVVETDDDGTPTSYVVWRRATCQSGQRKDYRSNIPNNRKAFRRITLSDENVTEIFEVKDSDGNIYYEVETLSQDTVFRASKNVSEDSDLVYSFLEVIPCPYRFVVQYDYQTKLTTLRFGSGDASTMDNDIIPDPAELALPLYGKNTFSRFTIDPNSLLNTQTLGIAPRNTTLTISYQYGGGLKHNVGSQTIRTVDILYCEFPLGSDSAQATSVRGSIDVTNPAPATDGANAPTLEQLRSQIPAARKAQSRLITKEDLLSRIYTLPNRFGRVYRVGIRDNPLNSMSAQIHLLSLDKRKKLTYCSDTLKKNLRTYLNEYRVVSDAYDILDARIINFGVSFEVVAHPNASKTKVAQTAIRNVRNILKTEFFQIDQPLPYSDIMNAILLSEGVISLVDLQVFNLTGTTPEGRVYSDTSFEVDENTFQQMIVPIDGAMFEMKYPESDIIATVR